MERACSPSEADFFIHRTDHVTADELEAFHIHRRYEIFYEMEGTRRYFIEDASYLVHEGSVVLIGDGQLHKTGAVSDGPFSRIVLSFRPGFLAELQQVFPDVDFFSFLSRRENHLLNRISIRQQNRIYGLLQQMLDLEGENNRDADITRKMLLATLLLFLKHLCQEQRAQGGSTGRVSNRIVEQVQHHIAMHYAEKMTLTDIAHQFHISPYYLSRLFKRTINLSLVEYANSVRIKAAQHLLEETECSISQIAEKTGFATAAHFRRVFKAASGYSPQQYRLYYHRFHPSADE